MIPWEEVDRGEAGTGDEALSLHRRGDEWSIRSAGVELMNNRKTGSERALAELAAAATGPPAARASAARVLVGGLGLGFTTRAALDVFPAARVVVVEISPKVIEWNRGPLAPLAGAPLADPRCELVEGDIGDLLRRAGSPEEPGLLAVLLDVDNGPEALSRPQNDGLYAADGLRRARRALASNGVLAVWSAGPSSSFEKRLREAYRTFETHRISPRVGGKGRARHTVWVAGPALGPR